MIVSPGKWVSEEQLIALKGIKKGTLKVSVQQEPY
ncbi:putative excisionase [Escherichia coli]|nr:putative excisionase [Escherichia coli]